MERREKIVEFSQWCPSCKYANAVPCETDERGEDTNPCDECLANPTNEYSHKPVCYKENK